MGLRLRFLQVRRSLRTGRGEGLGRGLALRGRVWLGDERGTLTDGVVVVDGSGRISAVHECAARAVPLLPEGLRLLGSPGHWVGPGVVDAHVHLAFGEPERVLAGGVVAVRDLGAPPARAAGWRGAGPPRCSVAGPVVTAPGGYPSRTWGARGFAAFADSPAAGRALVRSLVADGVDLLKLALEPSGGAPVPAPPVLRALVDAAHAAGLGVTAHALTAEMVLRALDAGVDELAHVPVALLGDADLDQVAAAGVAVVSTLQTSAAGGHGRRAMANATGLHARGVRLLYGTDLGNTGTRPGVDPRELDRLADAGLGREGALRRAVEGARWAIGLGAGSGNAVGDGTLRPGQPAALVLLPEDPLGEPAAWRAPAAVVAGGRLVG